jgi:hypothetical protein
LWDHREAPPDTDMSDRDSLLAGLLYAYGDSAADNGGWVDLDRIVAEVWDPDTDPQDARRFYLNQVTHATDAWLSQPEWAACAAPDKVVGDGEAVTLGFDGSKGRTRGVADSTGIVGCRVSDGHLFEVGVWEEPPGPAGDGWRVPALEVDAAVRNAFRRWRVIGFFGDPSRWEGYFAQWEAEFSRACSVKAGREHPFEWWMTSGRLTTVVRALEQIHSAIVNRELTHDGSYALTRHMLNARRRPTRAGLTIAKEHPDSPRKIDLAVAATAAWEARLAAVAAGAGRQLVVPRRIR